MKPFRILVSKTKSLVHCKTNNVISIILVVIATISAYGIVYIKLDWGFPIARIANAEEVNEILLNLSYSYLTGFFVYILTYAIPFWIRKRRISKPVNDLLGNIESNLEACARSVFPITQYNKIEITRENVARYFANKNFGDKCSLSLLLAKKDISILEYCILKNDENNALIDHVLTYRDYLSSTIMVTLEKLRDPTNGKLLQAYKEIGESSMEKAKEDFIDTLFKQIELIKQTPRL